MPQNVPRDFDGEPSIPAQQREEILYSLAILQVRLNVLRRAQTLGPQFVEELQTVIDNIQLELSALST